MASLTILSTTKPSSTLSSTPQESKFPAKSQRPFSSTVKFRATPFKVCAFPSNNNDNGAKDDCFSTRRSLLVCISTLPFLFGFHEMEDLSAKALQSDTNTYMLIKEEVRKVVSKGKAAGVLRLVFHDAGTFEMDGNSGGMNGSIVYELERPENSGLKKSLKILDKAKGEVDAIQQGGMSSMVGLPSDHALVEDDECLRWIKKYADNQNMFFDDFKKAYIKLVNSGARWKSL